MTDSDFIIELFCHVDDAMKTIKKHPQAQLYPGELVTLGMVFALKGSGTRAFYRWISRNFRDLFPKLLERSRFFRALKPLGRKGLSNRRWIVGNKLAFLLNHRGLVVAWDCDPTNVCHAHQLLPCVILILYKNYKLSESKSSD